MSNSIDILTAEENLPEGSQLRHILERLKEQVAVLEEENAHRRASEALLHQQKQFLQDEINERKRAEETLRESEERYRRLVELSPDMVAIHCDGRFVYVNPAGAKLLAVASPEELIGKAVLDVVHPDYRVTVTTRMRQNQKGKQTPLAELKIVRLNGEPVDVETSGTPTTYQDKPAGQVIIRDITARKQVEQALIESEELLQQSQKMEAIGTLAGGVAHDFNNLLTVILGNTQVVLNKLPSGDPMQLLLVEVQQAGERASVLTRQLLAFSRRQILERTTLNLNDTISEIMKLLQRIIGEDVEVRVKFAPTLSAVFADRAQVEQVVMNLAVNARDAMPEGGQLTIETSNVELDEAYHRQHPYVIPGKYVEISVSDSGIGMDEETRARVFEPFFTTKDVGKGTGLGLSMVYGIVKQHDGHINVYSEVGHGTTVKVFLPVVEKAIERQTEALQLPLRGGGETILVAEDEEPLRNLAKLVLEGLGYTVLLAQDGKAAVEVYEANRERIDMLLLDVVMPQMGGSEAYERIRELGGEVPLLFMTGYSSETVQSRFVKQSKFMEGLNAGVLQKPYSVEALGRKIREVLDETPRTDFHRLD